MNLPFMRKPPYKKRPCDIKMRLVPYGGGWIDVHLDIARDSLYFVISCTEGDEFYALLRALYYLHPNQGDSENCNHIVDSWYGICKRTENGYEVERIVQDSSEIKVGCVVRDVPWKTEFTWSAEFGTESKWTLEREPTLATDFMLKLTIDEKDGISGETKHHVYEVPYKDLCYAIAKTCTEVLKSHGIYGYHHSVYNEDMHLRYLLFIKAVALSNLESRALTYNERGNGESSSLEKELELLMFDM